MAPLPALVALLPGIPLTPPPPLPARAPQERRRSATEQGSTLTINGRRQQARWLMEAGELWLPLEVLEGQLGMSRSDRPGGGLEIEWFGEELQLTAGQQRSLDDEVAVPVMGLLKAVGVNLQRNGADLELQLPA
jgi:hypothetical protein